MIAHPVANIFPAMSEEEFQALKADIAEHGQREPIWVWEGQILDGRHRDRACAELGLQVESKEYEGDEESLASFVISLNLKRRHLNESQRGLVAAKLANLSAGRPKNNSANLQSSQAGAAEMLNVSTRTVSAAVKLKDYGAPELVRAVEVGKVSVSAAADVAALPKEEQREIVARGEKEILQAAKRIRQERSAEVVAKNAERRREAAALPVPTGEYRTIVIDPPWPMEIIGRDVTPDQIAMPYPVMSLEEINAMTMPVAENATVYLWTTQKFLPAAFECLKSWGLTYRFAMVWRKSGGFQPFNMPQFNCEFVLVGTKGDMLFMDTKQFFTCFDGARREHSRKPDEFYDLVRRVSPEPRIDIFSREARDGFDQYGNEPGKFAA